MLFVALLPMAGLQFAAVRELQQQRRIADGAHIAATEMAVLQEAGNVIPSMYAEYTATLGIARAEELGIDRGIVADAIGVDFLSIVDAARDDMDAHLDELTQAVGDMVLPNGDTVASALGSARASIAEARAAFDRGAQTTAGVTTAFESVAGLLDDIRRHATAAIRPGQVTTTLARLGAGTDQMLIALDHATAELRYVADAGMTGGPDAPVTEMMMEAGALDASLAQLADFLDADQQAALGDLLHSTSLTSVASLRSEFVDAVLSIKGGGGTLETDGAQVQVIVDTMLASFDRLTDLQAFAGLLLQHNAEQAQQISDDAHDRYVMALVAMIGVAILSLLLLALVIRSILRPLSRLAERADEVIQGDLHVPPLQPTGPTDLRVLTRTFNDMVTTLRDYDRQVARLATGATEVDTALPGALGDTVRRSVTHLAEVTRRLHESEAAAVQQARTDALTGLANRTLALEQLADMAVRARMTSRRGAVIFLDLDGFKSINDSEGHAEGDHILTQIGERLRDTFPEHLVARIGGDEFVVLVQGAENLDDITMLAREMIALVGRPTTGVAGRTYSLSASAGVAMVDGSREPLTSIAQADSAVYRAKERGRGQVQVYDDSLAHAIEDRADMALTMRQALSDDQFFLVLQPIVDAVTLEPVGAEALLRWRRPGLGETLPHDFIPIAERTGAILDLERWVLEQAVGLLREWRIDPATARLQLTVNISGRHIVDGGLSDLLEVLCRRARIDPTLLHLEITETHLVADIARASAVVDDLREQGVKVAIDDFGTGYSSMSYLHRLTVDTMKIDRVFIAGMTRNMLDRSIVELLLRLGDSLGMRVVAEGVDSEEKLEMLREMGCHLVQGFHIARPMPVDDATEWLRVRSHPRAPAG
ncbi:MAG: EAL domain-containing protein [Ilumatobacteraceae bacterium]|nr:EAL domain-containing protein [Ilumatobacter sp.]